MELVAIQVVGHGLRANAAVPEHTAVARSETALPPRRAYFGPDTGWIETKVRRRGDLAQGVDGPLIVEEYDATCLVLPGWHARLDEAGNIAIERL